MYDLPLRNADDMLSSLRSGDIEAFNTLYSRYSEIIAYKLKRLIKLSSVVEEIHQDVFIKFWNHREQIEDGTNIEAYLNTIARNLVIDFYRKAARDKEIQQELISYFEDSYEHIESLLFEKENDELLNKIISKLPIQRQRVYRMIKIEGKSYAEAASYFNVSLSTIKDHMAKSSQFVKNTIIAKYPDLLIFLIISTIF